MTQTQVSGSGIKNNVITNNHLHSAANIAGSKLADSGVTAGSYGSSSATLSLTINAKGLITAASTNSITQVGGDNGVDFNDNVKARFGTGNDLQIYHDGTKSIINEGGTGWLEINTNNLRVQNAAANETLLYATQNGSVQLMYDNSKKFETNNTGAFCTGELGCDTLYMSDNDKAKFGSNDDLQIFHTGGSHSQIADTTGHQLYITADNALYLQSYTGSENYIKCVQNGAVELYHNNSKKLETTSGGIEVTGGINLTSNLSMLDNSKLKLGNGDDLQIYHDGSDSFIKDAGTGGIRIDTSQILIRNADGSQYIMQGSHNGDTALYQSGNYRAATRSWGFQVNGVLAPEGDNNHDIGFSSERWDDIYATNGTIQTSDKNEKNTITASDLGLSFVNKLKPVSYKFNNKTRTHYGLIAQDVETTLSDISKPTSDFAGFIKEDIPDKLYVENDDIPEGKEVGDVKTAAFTTYGLRYHEFISPLIKAVQELSAEVETLKTEVAVLKAR